MNTQTPPEKLTLERTILNLKEWTDLKWSQVTEDDWEALSSALSHLEGAQADKARLLDLLEAANCPNCRNKVIHPLTSLGEG